MMLTIERTARKEHSCWRCEEPIHAGERYQEVKLPPGDGEVGNETWLRSRQHIELTCYVRG